MGVGKGNVEVIDIDHTFLLLSMNTQPGFSLISATAFLVLQEMLTSDSSRCATGEATLGFGRGEWAYLLLSRAT